MISAIMSSLSVKIFFRVILVSIVLTGHTINARAQVSTHTMAEFSSQPISLIESAVSPQVIINASNDHQLFFKAYNDYSDLTGDGVPETTYINDIEYFGYFDSYKCYDYDSTQQRFVPVAHTADKYCTGANDAYWSGNFLNWASMTRIDAIRKILFGGHRRIDTSNETVLERAYLPPDIHAFAKYYKGSDVNALTPFTVNTTAPTGKSASIVKLSSTLTAIRTSLSAVEIGTGSKNFLTQTGDWFEKGEHVKIIDSANYLNFMEGDVTEFIRDSGWLTVNVTKTGGSGSFKSWNIIKVISLDTNQAGNWVKTGDYVTIYDTVNSNVSMAGWVTSFDSFDGNPLEFHPTKISGSGTYFNWVITNLSRVGLTLCNVTDSSTANIYSQNVSAPPLIRAAAGNYTFWSAGEAHQCLWEEEDPGNKGQNFNNPSYSGVYAAQDNPRRADVGLGGYDYVARVEVCKDSDGDGVVDLGAGTEKCKQYPHGNLKPIGLLQVFGDEDRLMFGMIGGTYGKSITGGEIIQKVANIDEMDGMCREINLGRDCNGDGDVDGGTDVGFVDQDDWDNSAVVPDDDDKNAIRIGDGTFKRVYQTAGGPITHAEKSQGVINTWELLRIFGYQYSTWNYGNNSPGDKCPVDIDFFGDTSGQCHNWGNPFAEIYLSGLRYFAGENSPTAFQSSDGQFILGINYNTGVWVDPLNSKNYCSKLNVVNFNSSVISADTVFTSDPATIKDELDTNSFGVVKDLNSPRNSKELTAIIGRVEGVYPDAASPNKKWFVGESGTAKDKMCTAKTITNLGDVRGLCPEGPDLRGGFRVAGLAWYAHVNDIRPDTLLASRGLEGIQKVDTYAVRLASGNPVIEIPVPNSTSKVTLLPTCINNNKDGHGCTMVDFKILERPTTVGDTGHGKFLVIWEDSLQGSDYDLDAGGTIEYTITPTQITIATGVTLETLTDTDSLGLGYVISGTTEDGLHIHSGTNGFNYTDPTSIAGCSNCYGIADGGAITSRIYSLGSTNAGLLEDPLWYAAKWGGFEDKNDNDLPDLTEEWDNKINATGMTGSDGIPDNYFYASNPKELESALNRVFMTILERTSSGTAAAVVSNNVRGEGVLYQAYYEPLKKDLDDREASWLGTVHALWLDSYGHSRQDCRPGDNIAAGECTPNGMLDNYDIDQVVETYFDDAENRTRVKVYKSDDPDSFNPYSMEGVVTAYGAGNVTLAPYSMEGVVSHYDSLSLTLNPYSMRGIVNSYNPDTGEVVLSVTPGSMQGEVGRVFTNWQIYDSTALLSGRSNTSMSLADGGTLTFFIDPKGEWVSVNDIMTLSTYNVQGEQGKSYDNWYVDCLTSDAESSVAHSIKLANTGEKTLTVQDDVFTGCQRVKISTFNLKGTPGNTYSDWDVSNLSTGMEGTSNSTLTLMESGELQPLVSPAVAWIKVGDRLMLSNYQCVEKEMYDIGYLWNAREQLYLKTLTDAQLKSNRIYSANASSGRHIMTWIDSDFDSFVDSTEYKDFEQTLFGSVSYGYFDVTTQAEAENIINYIRGVEIPGFRSRTVKYTADETVPDIMRLGDIVNSTPTVVSSPQEAFNILYDDTSYTDFRNQYANRRLMIYVGGNDGLLHAFNGGFYGVVNDSGVNKVSYLTNGKNCATGDSATAHPLGSEIWAYAPMNLLPHLKWLKDPNYTHVYYVDSKPRVFDARIFTADTNHPNGWGTLLVVGMRLGGGAMTIDTGADGFGFPNQANDRTMRSAFVIFDITNPENEPVLLGEIQVPDGSFSFVYPAVMAFGDNNKWYLLFGNGPNNIQTAASTLTAKIYFFDLAELVTPGITTSRPVGCSLTNIGTSSMKIITCDTGIANSFLGSPVVVDWDLDYQTDTAYFGLVGNANAISGRLMRLALKENSSPGFWGSPTTLLLTNQPVVAQPAVGMDNLQNKWVYFGTGRYYAMADKTSVAIQTLYGVKDDGSGSAVNIFTDLVNATDIDVYVDENRTIENGPNAAATGEQITNLQSLITEVDKYKKGWYVDLPPITGTAGTVPATRNFTESALLGGILFTSVFQPSADPCAGEGYSRLYGLYYKTGTAYPSPTIFGTDIVISGGEVKYQSLKYVNLGRGMASAPSLHSGTGSGDDSVSVFTQLSTGNVFRQKADTASTVRSGKSAWSSK